MFIFVLLLIGALLFITFQASTRKESLNLDSKAALEKSPAAVARYCQNQLTQGRCDDFINCKWFDCAYKGRGGCFSTLTRKKDVCPACSNNYDITSCNKAGGCAWYACAYNSKGGCYKTGTDQETVCPKLGCKTFDNKKACSENSCVWYGCAYQGNGGCFRPGTSTLAACPGCEQYRTIDACNSSPGKCAWYGSCNKCAQTGTSEFEACNPGAKSMTPKPPCPQVGFIDDNGREYAQHYCGPIPPDDGCPLYLEGDTAVRRCL